MSFRIAAASTDGRMVNKHFGKAETFYIYDVTDTGAQHLVETRSTQHACQNGGPSESGMAAAASLLADCRYVLVSQIGPCAENALASKGVSAFCITQLIDEAIAKVFAYDNRVVRKKKQG